MRILILITLCFIFSSCDSLWNNPPQVPSVPEGPNNGIINTIYNFTTSTTDPDTDNISYQFDFGYGDTSDWTNFVDSGTQKTMSHSFASPGLYLIRARAKDIHQSISEWSLAHQILIAGIKK